MEDRMTPATENSLEPWLCSKTAVKIVGNDKPWRGEGQDEG
jgi:hypothetical protein